MQIFLIVIGSLMMVLASCAGEQPEPTATPVPQISKSEVEDALIEYLTDKTVTGESANGQTCLDWINEYDVLAGFVQKSQKPDDNKWSYFWGNGVNSLTWTISPGTQATDYVPIVESHGPFC